MSSYLAGACWVPTTWSLWQKPQCQSQASCLPLPCLSLLTTTSLFSTSVILFSFVQQCKSTMHAKSLQSCLTLCDPMDSSSPWDSPGKNTGSPPGDLPHPGIESASLMSSVLAAGSLPQAPSEKPRYSGSSLTSLVQSLRAIWEVASQA